MTSLLVGCTPFFMEAASNTLKTPYFHMHISVSEFVIPLCCRVSVCSTLHNSWLLPHVTIQPLEAICNDQYSVRPSALLGQCVEICNLTMLGFQMLTYRASAKCFYHLLLSLSPSLTTQCLAFITSRLLLLFLTGLLFVSFTAVMETCGWC